MVDAIKIDEKILISYDIIYNLLMDEIEIDKIEMDEIEMDEIEIEKVQRDNLYIDQRYTFHIRNKGSPSTRNIRANIKSIINNKQTNQTIIILYAVDNEGSKKTEVSIPFEWIVHVENLDSILHNTVSVLSSDILLLIDNYM